MKPVDQSSQRILSLALEALYSERQKIDIEIASLQRQLRGRSDPVSSARREGVASDRISPAGRKAISDAMKKRWAKYRAMKAKRARSR
jgi:hypothetical protein